MAESTNENLYLLVAKELSINKRDEALWTMAFALENGDEAKTKAHYIRLRVAQLTSELSNSNTSARAADGTPNKQPSSPPQPDISVCWQRAADQPNSDQPDLRSEYAAVVGEKNLDYYLARFAKFDDQESGIKASWNWAAFFFSGFWALYRKMYGWFAFFLLLGAIANALQRGMDRATPDSSGINGFVAHTLIYLLPQILFGIFANGLYWKKCKSKIQQARSTTRDEQRALMNMQQNGGVLGWLPKVAITLAVVIPVLGIVMSIVIPKYTKPGLTRQLPESASSPSVSAPASQQSKTPSTLFTEADAAYARQDYPAYRAIVLTLANQGIAMAQERLGYDYASPSFGWTQPDNKEALRWYLAAAKQGLASSQVSVGNMYAGGPATGTDLPQKDLTQAVKWYRMAADQGDARGYFYLGMAYEKGEGVQQDYKEANKWFRLAVQKEPNTTYVASLAQDYQKGQGVPLSIEAAFALMTVARAICLQDDPILCEFYAEDTNNMRTALSPSSFRQANALAIEMTETRNILGPLDRFIASR